MTRLYIPFILVILLSPWLEILSCTSALIAPQGTSSGSVLLWKHRDTSNKDNYVDSVRGVTPDFDYIALFNATDTLKLEAWAGVNRSGFAIINTVAGNLPKNKPDWKDREGYLMSKALATCKTVSDFEHLVNSLPRPMGVQANFGVADSTGAIAYFEVSDNRYVKYLPASEEVYMLRTNFAMSAGKKGGYGYERFNTAQAVVRACASDHAVTPELFTETLSREYLPKPKVKSGLIKDKDFIPRPTSSSSVVIEIRKGAVPVMWTMLGYPPASYVVPVTIDEVPESVRRNPLTGKSDLCSEALKLKGEMLRNGYVDIEVARRIMDQQHEKSMENYRSYREKSHF